MSTSSVLVTGAAAALAAVIAIKCFQRDEIENFEGDSSEFIGVPSMDMSANPAGIPTAAQLDSVQGFPGSATVKGVTASKFGPISECALERPGTLSSSLLPAPTGDEDESFVDPGCMSNALANQQMMSALDLIGVNTVATTLKNASVDLRGDPVCNPREPVSVFNNSSIACTLNRPLTCYNDIDRPSLYSCDWNSSWYAKNTPQPSQMS